MADTAADGGVQLTDREQARVRHLEHLDEQLFEDAVEDYVYMPTDEERRLFRSPQLALRTHETLTRLRQWAGERLNHETDPDMRARYTDAAARFKAEQRLLGPELNKARARAAAGSPRQQALKILSELHYKQFRWIMRRLRDGDSPDEVLRAARAGEGP